MAHAVFLPGASGRRAYWQPVADRLRLDAEPLLLGWPGFDDVPADPRIRSLTDLVDYVLGAVEGPMDLVTQSMGGVVAILVALREPERVRQIVLCGTSGGIDTGCFETQEWRAAYLAEIPETAPRWFVDDRTEVSDQISSMRAPVLLLWGEDDRVSPPAIGRYLAGLLP